MLWGRGRHRSISWRHHVGSQCHPTCILIILNYKPWLWVKGSRKLQVLYPLKTKPACGMTSFIHLPGGPASFEKHSHRPDDCIWTLPSFTFSILLYTFHTHPLIFSNRFLMLRDTDCFATFYLSPHFCRQPWKPFVDSECLQRNAVKLW